MNYDRFCFLKSKPNEKIFDLEFWHVSCIVEIKVLYLLHQSTVLNINDIIPFPNSLPKYSAHFISYSTLIYQFNSTVIWGKLLVQGQHILLN